MAQLPGTFFCAWRTQSRVRVLQAVGSFLQSLALLQASTLLRFYASTDFHTLPQNFILSRTFSCLRLWPALPCLALPWPSPCPRPCLALALRISRTFSCLWLFLPHPEGLPALKSLAKNKIKNKNQKAPSQDTHTGSTLTAPPRLVSSRLASSQLFYYLYRTAGPRQHPL